MLVHFPCVTVPVYTVEVEWGGLQSVQCEGNYESGMLSGNCNVQGMKWGLWGVKCRV